MMVRVLVLHNILRDFLFGFFFFQGVLFSGNPYILMICVRFRIRKGHFHQMELHPGQLDLKSISNINIQEIDS